MRFQEEQSPLLQPSELYGISHINALHIYKHFLFGEFLYCLPLNNLDLATLQ